MERLVWQLAGILGLDPGPFTLAELLIMAEARSRERWAHTAAILALLANCHRDRKKSRPFQPADFHPYLRRATRPLARVGIAILRQVFVDLPSGRN